MRLDCRASEPSRHRLRRGDSSCRPAWSSAIARRPLEVPLGHRAPHGCCGATGSGKSTLIAELLLRVLDLTRAPRHRSTRDLRDDILERVPARHANKGPCPSPRRPCQPRPSTPGENHTRPGTTRCLGIRGAHSRSLADFTGRRCSHYLRHALLTLLAAPEPQTILRADTVLPTTPSHALHGQARRPAARILLGDRMAIPVGGRTTTRSRPSSTNSAFVSYDSIRDVVARVSPLSGHVRSWTGATFSCRLLAVGGDNARLFGDGISRFYSIDRATGNRSISRQHFPLSTRIDLRYPKRSAASSTKAASLGSLWSRIQSLRGMASACATRC